MWLYGLKEKDLLIYVVDPEKFIISLIWFSQVATELQYDPISTVKYNFIANCAKSEATKVYVHIDLLQYRANILEERKN